MPSTCLYRRRRWHSTPVLLPGKPHGRRSLVGCSPWDHEESDTTERLHFHFSLSCTGEGHGNALQCSCLKNPRDGGAWWAAVYGVEKSRTRLKWLSSSSSSTRKNSPFYVPIPFFFFLTLSPAVFLNTLWSLQFFKHLNLCCLYSIVYVLLSPRMPTLSGKTQQR